MLEWLGGDFDPARFNIAQVSFDDPAKRWKIAFEDAAGVSAVRERTEKFQARYVVKTPGIKISRKRWGIRAPCYPWHSLPQRGGKVAPGCLVDHIIEGAGPLYIERVWGFDFWGFNDLACLAVPVVWHRKNPFGTVLAKVILTVMPYEQATLLEPQLQKLKPEVIPERFQFI